MNIKIRGIHYTIALSLLAMAAISTAITLFYRAITTSGIHYASFTTPMTAVWVSFASFIIIFFYLIWSRGFERSKFRVWFWRIAGAGFALFGIIDTIVFAAVSPMESLASGLSFLFWVIPGALILAQTISFEPAQKSRFCSWKLVYRIPSAIILGFFLACIVAIFVQCIAGAVDLRTYQPIGTVYSVELNDSSTNTIVPLKIHLACLGRKSSSSNVTWIFEHGGGSNSASLRYLVEGIAAAGFRACSYDRLGYGWTPSQYTRANPAATEDIDDTAVLARLLSVANETGPFICAGHSAGAEKCLRFAQRAASLSVTVRGIAFLDGYPDYVRAGMLNGVVQGALATVLKLFAFLVGPTGFTRNIVGNPGPGYVPKNLTGAMTSLYAQSRFWNSQMWDVVGDVASGSAGYVYSKLNGTQNATTSLVRYGNNLNITVGVFPAHYTVMTLNCTETPRDSCCSGSGQVISDEGCNKQAKQRADYLAQSLLYANTIAIQPGIHTIAPVNSTHSYVYNSPDVDWLIAKLLNDFYPRI